MYQSYTSSITISGNSSVWHGFADIFVNRSVVMVTGDTELDTNIDGDCSETSNNSGEPLKKKRRYEYDRELEIALSQTVL